MVSILEFLSIATMLTEDATGPEWGETPLAVKLTPLGALSLTSRAARKTSARATAAQFEFRTCGSVVEVLVDKLERRKSAIA